MKNSDRNLTIYKNANKSGIISKFEYASTQKGSKLFLHLRDETAVDRIKDMLSKSGAKLNWVAHSNLGNSVVLVGHSSHETDKAVLGTLEKNGEHLERVAQHKAVDPWVIRSLLGFGGQALTLTSAMMRPPKPEAKGRRGKLDKTLFVFATANLTANVINLAFKAQSTKDPSQLRYLKEQLNNRLSPEMEPGHFAPSADDERNAFREKSPEDTGTRAAFTRFMERYSVNIGELGLRFLGAFNLVSPMGNWKSILKGKAPALNKEAPLRMAVGIGSIVGKGMALTSKIPDPYNDKPKTKWDTFREKYSFLAGGIVEAGAFSVLAYDNFTSSKPLSATQPSKRSIMFKGRPYRDILGTAGAAMFVTGYIIRSWAKFGTRHVDMDELYAHVSDTLAQLPPEKIPQLLADTTAYIQTHFKDTENLEFGSIYTALKNDLKRYHHIDVTAEMPNEAYVETQSAPKQTLADNAATTQLDNNGPIKASSDATEKAPLETTPRPHIQLAKLTHQQPIAQSTKALSTSPAL
jgi:hypothetical protein